MVPGASQNAKVPKHVPQQNKFSQNAVVTNNNNNTQCRCIWKLRWVTYYTCTTEMIFDLVTHACCKTEVSLTDSRSTPYSCSDQQSLHIICQNICFSFSQFYTLSTSFQSPFRIDTARPYENSSAKMFNFSYPERNFRGNQLLDASISLSPLYPSVTNDLPVSIVMSFHQSFPWLRPSQA